MIRRLLLLALGLLLVTGGVFLYRYFNRPQGLMLTGIVTTHEVNVSPLIQGRLSQLLVKEGDAVKAGQLVAVIDPQELQADRSYYAHTEQGAAAQVEEQEAALNYQQVLTRDQIKQAEAALAAAEAQAREVAADLELNRVNYERAGNLYQKQVYSAQALDQARTAYEASKAHAESLQKLVETQRANVALARSNENQITVRLKELQTGRRQLLAAGAQKSKADVRLGYTEVRAPINGVVAVLAARQGEVLSVSQPILILIDPEDLWVRADVEETYIDRIRLGDRLTVRLPSGVERAGTVFYRAVVADFATQRDVSRAKRDIKTFEIRLRLDNGDRRLWPGLTAYVMLPLQDVQGAPQVSN
ncbi:MAG: efflux RND transporter periplasmic adaptor subunit [Acidobacteriia bacterium]|nr:efflux RND transporter periplasmic adaptor subunit [Terriglobia bacterium]